MKRKAILGSCINESLDSCTEIISQEVERYKPDLVIGSSWGGAVACQLIKKKIWGGPTLILCPAYLRIKKYTEENEQAYR